MKLISIDKNKIPYEFELVLGGETYQLAINYNMSGDFFTVDLYKNHVSVLSGEKMVYGVPLFDNFKYLNVPGVVIVPYDFTGKASRVGFDDLGEDVFLYVERVD